MKDWRGNAQNRGKIGEGMSDPEKKTAMGREWLREYCLLREVLLK